MVKYIAQHIVVFSIIYYLAKSLPSLGWNFGLFGFAHCHYFIEMERLWYHDVMACHLFGTEPLPDPVLTVN